MTSFREWGIIDSERGDIVTIEEKIRVLLAYCRMSQAELARKIGTTPSNLNQKLKRDTLTQSDLQKIAEVTGCEWRAHFVLQDGTMI